MLSDFLKGIACVACHSGSPVCPQEQLSSSFEYEDEYGALVERL
jgi:hypothetical protein